MGKESGWLHQQHSPRQLPDLNCTSSMPELGQQNIVKGCTYPHTCILSASASLPGHANSESPHLKADQANDLNGWFYCLPRHRQSLVPSPNVFTKEMLSALPCGCGGKNIPNSVPGAVQNRFLVFDQSGNQTSWYFGSPVSPVRYPASKKPKLFDIYSSCQEERTSKFQLDMNLESRHVISDGLDENQETGEESEMHEDTEELDALLYSDGDSDYDDEETSTGHYQGDSSEPEAQKVPEGSAEDVASSMGTSKRKNQLDEKQLIGDTASSSKPNVSWDYQDDADSSCVKGREKIQEEEMNTLPSNKRVKREKIQEEEMNSLPSNKRVKREKIREAVSILQSIIPGGKGKDAMFVLDEAIRYLRSMKAQS